MANTKNYDYFQNKLNIANQRIFELEQRISYLEDVQVRINRQIKDLEVITDALMNMKRR